MAALNDWQGYLAANPDLAAAGITDAAGAQAHYDQYGAAEGRANVGGATAAPAAPAGITGTFGTTATADQIKSFFGTNPDANKIAQAASGMGLTEAQLNQAMQIGGYGGYNSASPSGQSGTVDNAINSWVSTPTSGYSWGANGALTANSSASTAPPTYKPWGTAGATTPYQLTQTQIQDYWNTNKNDPKKIYDAMTNTGATYADVAKAAGMSTYELNQYLFGAQMSDISHPYLLDYRGLPVNSLGQDMSGDPNWRSKIDLRQNDPNFGYYEKRGGSSGKGTFTGLQAGMGNYGVMPGSNSVGGTNYRVSDGESLTGGGTSGGIQSNNGNSSVNNGGMGYGSGSSYSSSNGTPQMNLASLQGGTNMGVDPRTQTVAGQLQSVLANDSPLIQQARTRALQTANANGRLNTTMAQTGADAAMYDAAMGIAVPDANTYNLAAQTNAATANTFARDANAFARQQDMANFNVNANDWAAQQADARQAARDAALNAMGVTNSATANTNSTSAAATAATNAANAKAMSDLNNARAEFASKVAAISTDSTMDTQSRTDAIASMKINYNAIIKLSLHTLGWDTQTSWYIDGTGA